MIYGSVVIYDACVLYPSYLRDVLIQLAMLDLFQAKWTEQIQEEWTRSLLNNRPNMEVAKVQRLCKLMRKAVPDALIREFAPVTDTLVLPDSNDRHVLAAAIAAKARVIVNFNLKDFPRDILTSYCVMAQSPDEFISHWIEQEPEQMILAVEAIRSRYKRPSINFEAYMNILINQGLETSVAMIRQKNMDIDDTKR